MAEFLNVLAVLSTLWWFVLTPAAGESVQNMSRTWIGYRSLNCGGSSRLETISINSAADRNAGGSCSYTIRPNVLRVCQLRIDFDTNLAPPRQSEGLNYAHCADDAIIIENHHIELCGANSNQHIYVPWTVKTLFDTRRIEVRIANRDNNPRLPAPTWTIKVTQIKCAGPMITREHPLKAPAGCDQYFTQPEGIVSSFNYNAGLGPYPGNLQYSICFRRQSQDAALDIIPVIFEMSTNLATGLGYDTDCFPQQQTPGSRTDFLAITGARFTDNNQAVTFVNRFCGTGLVPDRTVTVESPGPFTMQFSTDRVTDVEEKGFRLRYSIR